MRILNFGSLNIDYVYSVNHFMRPGETQASTKFEVFCGGKGLNQSIALKRSGVDVWHAGAVGETDSALLLIALSQAGVNTDYIKKCNGSSGHAIIQKDLSGQNSILLYGGVNQSITIEYANSVLSHFDKGDFLILQNEISCIKEIIEIAHKKGLIIIFNPSPMSPAVLEYPLENVDYFLLNEVEASEMCGMNGEGEALLDKMVELYPRAHIILTLGENGVLYQYEKTRLKHGIYSVDAVDTTAAGDTFTGYFIGSIVSGNSVERALELSSKASAIAVSRPGAAPSIPTINEVLAL